MGSGRRSARLTIDNFEIGGVKVRRLITCMAERRDPALRAATKTRSSTASIRAKPGRNVGGCRTCCGNRARSLKRSANHRRKLFIPGTRCRGGLVSGARKILRFFLLPLSQARFRGLHRSCRCIRRCPTLNACLSTGRVALRHARGYLSFPLGRFGGFAVDRFGCALRFGCTSWSYVMSCCGLSEAHARLITIGEFHASQFKCLPKNCEGCVARFRCFALK
jgi:hypothetical protein